MSELRQRVGLSSSALAQRVPDDEVVCDRCPPATRSWAAGGDLHDEIDDAGARHPESVGAEHLADRTHGTSSEGERKRVLIARALMTDPSCCCFDELAGGPDLGGREELVARLANLAAGPGLCRRWCW